jgi:hypothetical protein
VALLLARATVASAVARFQPAGKLKQIYHDLCVTNYSSQILVNRVCCLEAIKIVSWSKLLTCPPLSRDDVASSSTLHWFSFISPILCVHFQSNAQALQIAIISPNEPSSPEAETFYTAIGVKDPANFRPSEPPAEPPVPKTQLWAVEYACEGSTGPSGWPLAKKGDGPRAHDPDQVAKVVSSARLERFSAASNWFILDCQRCYSLICSNDQPRGPSLRDFVFHRRVFANDRGISVCFP